MPSTPPSSVTAAPIPETAGEPDLESLPAGIGEDQWTASSQAESAGSAGWKEALRRDFDAWLETIDEVPETDDAPDEVGEEPDLYSFFEQLVAANAESRRVNRRTAEAFSQWSETLARFESSLAPLRETTAQLAAAQPREAGMSRAHCLVLVELLDRIHRVARAFQSPPSARRWCWVGGRGLAWRRAWESQRQAVDILVSHLKGLLRQEGVTQIDTVGQPFDPAVMMAVAAQPDATRPPQTVLEELSAGYRRHGELLRAAQVKVTRTP